MLQNVGACYQTCNDTTSDAEYTEFDKYFGATYHEELLRDTECGSQQLLKSKVTGKPMHRSEPDGSVRRRRDGAEVQPEAA